ncbi:DUF3592 domain-containing protein [Microbacterium sp. GXS0129]|uniref:DUF3592 domain-containing protein n=1 Tax=Microbacterium sp. GXS0129 TaxID=3377836 RepID=UPI00383A80BD
MTVQTVVWGCWAAFVLIMVTVTAFGFRSYRRRARAMRTWPQVTAVVVGHREVADAFPSGDAGQGQISSALSSYRYTGPDGQIYEGKTSQPRLNPPSIGQQIVVCVNPERPAQSYPVEPTNPFVLGCALTLVGVLCVASFFFVRLLTG